MYTKYDVYLHACKKKTSNYEKVQSFTFTKINKKKI
jgi:hypothetical protein